MLLIHSCWAAEESKPTSSPSPSPSASTSTNSTPDDVVTKTEPEDNEEIMWDDDDVPTEKKTTRGFAQGFSDVDLDDLFEEKAEPSTSGKRKRRKKKTKKNKKKGNKKATPKDKKDKKENKPTKEEIERQKRIEERRKAAEKKKFERELKRLEQQAKRQEQARKQREQERKKKQEQARKQRQEQQRKQRQKMAEEKRKKREAKQKAKEEEERLKKGPGPNATKQEIRKWENDVQRKLTDYYKILKVDKKATKKEIKRAYKRQSVRFHPDKNRDYEHANEVFTKIAEAYEVLSDDRKRQMYDQFGKEGMNGQFADGDGGQGAHFDFGGEGFQFTDPFEMFRQFGAQFEQQDMGDGEGFGFGFGGGEGVRITIENPFEDIGGFFEDMFGMGGQEEPERPRKRKQKVKPGRGKEKAKRQKQQKQRPKPAPTPSTPKRKPMGKNCVTRMNCVESKCKREVICKD